jgi:lysine-N-methylase
MTINTRLRSGFECEGKDRVQEGFGSERESNNVQPTYAGAFRCIGPQCEDSCCGGWDIPVDRITYQRYRQFPVEKLGSLVANFVSECADKPHDNVYAYIRCKEDGCCPFFGADRLCGIQKEYGAALLTPTCSIYPRSLAVVSGILEGSLSLSCPEAARNVLLQENSVTRKADLLSGDFRTDSVFGVRQRECLDGFLLPVRALVVSLIRDRSRPIWQRLLIIASLCSRLNDVVEDDPVRTKQLLIQYENALGRGSSNELERLAPRVVTRLEVAITLTNRRCQCADCGQRFRDVFWDFIEGIGSTDLEGPDQDVHRFNLANGEYLAPLLDQSPFIAENYLLNYVYQHLFPFGRAGSDHFVEHSIFEEAVLLLTQFSWMTTLLTGVAGRYRHEFTDAQIVRTVQSFTRAVEHVPQVLEDALSFVKARNLDSLSGMAELLRT